MATTIRWVITIQWVVSEKANGNGSVMSDGKSEWREAKEQRKRSLAKTLTWRALATLTTMGLVYGFTQEVVVSLGVGIVEVVAKLMLYYVHERVWSRFGWGTTASRYDGALLGAYATSMREEDS